MENLILKRKKLGFKIIKSVGSEGKEQFQFHHVQCSVLNPIQEIFIFIA